MTEQGRAERTEVSSPFGRVSPGVVLGLLFLVSILNYLDRQIVNVLAEDIKADLKLSDTQLGLLTGAAFGLLYSVLAIPMGRLADRMDRMRLIALVLLVWSGFTALCGITQNFIQLALARMGVGVGEAGSQPASTALVHELFPPARRTTAMSVLLLSAPTGAFLGLLIGGLASAASGWRFAIFLAGAPGLVVALFMLGLFRERRPQRAVAADAPRASVASVVKGLMRNATFRNLLLILMVASFLVYASGAWLPAIYIRAHGLSTAEAGLLVALSIGIGGSLGALGSGYLCDRLRAPGREIEVKIVMAALVIAAPSLVLAISLPPAFAWAPLTVFQMCAFAFLGPIVTRLQEEAPGEHRALAIAICTSFSNVLNLCVGLPLVGALSDALAPNLGTDSIRVALGVMAVAAAILGTIGGAGVLPAKRDGSGLPA